MQRWGHGHMARWRTQEVLHEPMDSKFGLRAQLVHKQMKCQFEEYDLCWTLQGKNEVVGGQTNMSKTNSWTTFQLPLSPLRLVWARNAEGLQLE